MPKQEFLIIRKYFLSICICSIACREVQVNLQQLPGTKKFSLKQSLGHEAILYSNCFILIWQFTDVDEVKCFLLDSYANITSFIMQEVH